MENLLALLPMAKTLVIIGTPIKSNVTLPLICTEDIAEIASQKLVNTDFTGKTHLDLLGNRDYTHIELASIIGKALGKNDLPYVEFSYEDNKKGLIRFGLSESMADYFSTLYKGINDGVFITARRTVETTTPTSFETFISNFLNQSSK